MGVANKSDLSTAAPRIVRTNLISDEPQPLLIDLELLHLLQDDLGKDVQLVVVTINGEHDAISLRLEGVAQTGELGVVRVLGEGVLDELGEEARLDRMESGVVDDGTVRESKWG